MSVAPTLTYVAAGNIRAAATLAAAGTFTYTATAADGKLDLSSVFGGTVYVAGTGNTAVATTSGLRVQIARVETSGLKVMTVVVVDQTIAVAVSTAFSASWDLPPGRYSITCTNLDATNSLLNVEAGLSFTITSIG